MSDYGIELGLYINRPSDIIEIIKITPKTITVRAGLKRIDDCKLEEELGYKYLIQTIWAYEPKRYKIIADEDTVGIKNDGNYIRYFKNNNKFCYVKLDMEKVKFV